MQIVHVIESFGGGSLSAACGYAARTEDLSHVLVHGRREGEYLPEGELDAFERTLELPATGLLRQWRCVRAALRQMRPDVVHAHSSVAGALVRTAAWRGRVRIVYTPHCFAFERTDLGRVIRGLVWLVEAVLGLNTSCIAACSPRESALAKGLRTVRHVVVVPNVADPVGSARPRTPPDTAPVVRFVGRLAEQKAPAFAAEVARELRVLCPEVVCEWVGGPGDGSSPHEVELAAAGIGVTGWLPHSALGQRLATSAAYVHVAAWEGFPLTILEAVAARVPIVARRIPALASCPEEWLGAQPQEVARLVSGVLGDPAAAEVNRCRWATALAWCSDDLQRQGLKDAYEG